MLTGARVLVVDDEEILAENIRDFFILQGADTRMVFSGAEALDQIESFEPDLVMLDYNLPGMDGLETFVRLRAQLPLTEVVLMTGYPSEDLYLNARQHGIRRVLVKPFPFSELRALAAEMAGWPAIGPNGRRGPDRRQSVEVRFPLRLANGEVVATDRRRASSGAVLPVGLRFSFQ